MTGSLYVLITFTQFSHPSAPTSSYHQSDLFSRGFFQISHINAIIWCICLSLSDFTYCSAFRDHSYYQKWQNFLLFIAEEYSIIYHLSLSISVSICLSTVIYVCVCIYIYHIVFIHQTPRHLAWATEKMKLQFTQMGRLWEEQVEGSVYNWGLAFGHVKRYLLDN